MYEKQYFTCMVYLWRTLTEFISNKHTFVQWSINRNLTVLSGTKSDVITGWTSFRDSTQKFCDTCGQIVIKVSVVHSIQILKKALWGQMSVKCLAVKNLKTSSKVFPHWDSRKNPLKLTNYRGTNWHVQSCRSVTVKSGRTCRTMLFSWFNQ